MTLTIDMPDEVAERARAVAQSRGLDLNTFTVAAVVDATDADALADAETDESDMEIVAAALEAIEEGRDGRLLTLEEADARFEQDLMEARARLHAAKVPARDLSAALV